MFKVIKGTNMKMKPLVNSHNIIHDVSNFKASKVCTVKNSVKCKENTLQTLVVDLHTPVPLKSPSAQ